MLISYEFLSYYHSLHVKFAKRVLQYLECTKDNGIIYERSGNGKMVAFSDASHACDYFSGRSTSGILILMNGGPLFWKSTQQGFVTNSSMESEYAALSDTVNALMYLKAIKSEVFGSEGATIIYNKDKNAMKEIMEAVMLYCDNKAAVYVGNSLAPTKKSRSVNIRFHNVKRGSH